MKLGSPYRHVMLTAWNARWFHLGGDWTKHHIIMTGPCDDEHVCWTNPWPWGGFYETRTH